LKHSCHRQYATPALVDGKIDLVAAQFTVTPDRQKIVDFTNATRMNVSEILVTGAGKSPVASVDALSGQWRRKATRNHG
jgi:ABC-type amino acid transport substrate-binding protein